MFLLKLVLIVTAIAVAVLLVFTFIMFLCFFTRLFTPKTVSVERPIKKFGLENFRDILESSMTIIEKIPNSDVYIKSFDRVKLHARFFEQKDAKATVILCHGWFSLGDTDFSCIIPYYYEKGFNVLLVTQRAHYKSGGICTSLGVKEKLDCIEWIKFVNARVGSNKKVFLHGLSMGASTVLFASGCTLPENVSGIIADCGFTSPIAIVRKVAKNMHVYPYPSVWFIDIWFRLFIHHSLYSDSTIKSMKKNKLPILLIHGKKDDFVPCEMSFATYDACITDKNIVIADDAGHGQSYLYESERCIEALDEFYKKQSL